MSVRPCERMPHCAPTHKSANRFRLILRVSPMTQRRRGLGIRTAVGTMATRKHRFLLAKSIVAALVAVASVCLGWSQHGAAAEKAPECVVLLHGLARTAASMAVLDKALTGAGFTVVNVDYPSRKNRIERLAPMAMDLGIGECRNRRAGVIHFVTHSLGGILVRYHLAHHRLPELGRVVMLAPPNKGSEIADELRSVPGLRLLSGPAGPQLGTGKDSIPLKLGPPRYEVGVIAGTRSLNPVLSAIIPDVDDGKVSLENTKLEGMVDFIALPHTHTFMMRSSNVIRQTIHFLRQGRFDKAGAHSPDYP